MPRTPASDSGFSLVETLTSIAIIGVVMTALTTFFVSTTTTLNKQRGLQTAVRLAHDGVDLVKSLPGASILTGRSAKDVAEQFRKLGNGEFPGLGGPNLPKVAALLAAMVPASDPKLGILAASVDPVLPVAPDPVTIDNTVFTRYWFAGSCQMPLEGQPCGPAALPGNLIPFYRVVVAVTWNNGRACPKTGGVCSYLTQTLVSATPTDPVFNPNITVTRPLPSDPGNQTGEASAPMAAPLTLSATTANPPLTWTVTGQPPGIISTPAGVLSGTPAAAGVYTVRAEVTDSASTNEMTFTWTVLPGPAPAPVDQTWNAGAAVSYTLPVTGGVPPYTWTQVGLPTGLSLNPATGVITGSSTVSGAAASTLVTVTVTDKNKGTAPAVFRWTTKVAVQFPPPGTPIALTRGTAYTGNVGAAGGSGGYIWSSVNLPPGLTLSRAGVLTGAVTGSTRYLVTLTVSDSAGVTNTAVVPVNITSNAGQLRFTAPATTAPDRADKTGTALTTQTVVAGGKRPVAWQAAGLPPGLTLTNQGNADVSTISGTPNTPGKYTVTLTASDKDETAVFMFVWTIS